MKRKKVWNYKNKDKTYIINLYELENNILLCETEGIAYLEGTNKNIEFIFNYCKKHKNKKIDLIFENSKLQEIPVESRKRSLEFSKKDSPINKIASINENIYMRAFINLYSIVSKKPFRSFKNIKEAVEWFKKN